MDRESRLVSIGGFKRGQKAMAPKSAPTSSRRNSISLYNARTFLVAALGKLRRVFLAVAAKRLEVSG